MDFEPLSNLCPFCDLPLPTNPSTIFDQLLAIAVARSHPDPREWNPHGLRGTFQDSIEVCRRHEFESTILPRGYDEGWPFKIDWQILEKRVMERKDTLQPIVQGAQGAKEKSVFWNDLVKSFEKDGSRLTLDTKRQAFTFAGNQTG